MNTKCPCCKEEIFPEDCTEIYENTKYHTECYWDLMEDIEDMARIAEEESESPGYFFTEDGPHLM